MHRKHSRIITSGNDSARFGNRRFAAELPFSLDSHEAENYKQRRHHRYPSAQNDPGKRVSVHQNYREKLRGVARDMRLRTILSLVAVVVFAFTTPAQANRKVIIDQDARGAATTDQQSILMFLQSPNV